MSAALQSRIKALEAAQPQKPQSWIVCVPYHEDMHRHGELVADGVYRVEDRYRAGNVQVAYAYRAALDTWLALPEQAMALQCVYQIVTAESIAATLARIESEI